MTIENVVEIPRQQHESELKNNLSKCEYVLVYKFSPQSLHAVYVESYDQTRKAVDCINSHGHNDQYPRISLANVIKLFKVNCTAVDTKSLPSQSSGIKNFKVVFIISINNNWCVHVNVRLSFIKTS